MTAIDRLNEILKQLKQLEDDTTYSPYQPKSAASMMNALATFSENLPDITQQLETAIIEQEDEQKKATQFYNYFKELYGTGLEVYNWHQNGDTEPFDNFFDSAESE
jgi:hypothetical protein